MSSIPFRKQLLVDFLIVVLVFLPLVLIYALSEPSLNGFWCHDKTLSFPYKPDTISVLMLMVITFTGPLFVMAMIECVRAAFTARLLGQFRAGLLSLSKAYGTFFFGMVITLIFTEVLKYSVGRLRPNFFDVCRPDLDKINCTSDLGYPRFISTYTCTNKMADERLIRESRLSFPSGHASMSAFSALFTVFYLQLRMDVKFSHFLRPVIQLGLVLLAVMCCVTRITDFKHFSSDVIGGAAIGALLALLTFYKIGLSIIPSQVSDKSPRLQRGTSIESEPQTPIPLLRPERLVISHSYRNHSGTGIKQEFVHDV